MPVKENSDGESSLFSLGRMSVIGLDIGESSIKAVRIKDTSDGPKIMVFARQSIPPEMRAKKKARVIFKYACFIIHCRGYGRRREKYAGVEGEASKRDRGVRAGPYSGA